MNCLLKVVIVQVSQNATFQKTQIWSMICVFIAIKQFWTLKCYQDFWTSGGCHYCPCNKNYLVICVLYNKLNVCVLYLVISIFFWCEYSYFTLSHMWISLFKRIIQWYLSIKFWIKIQKILPLFGSYFQSLSVLMFSCSVTARSR